MLLLGTVAQDIIRKIQRDLATGQFSAAQKRVKSLAKKEPQNAGLQNLAGMCFAKADAHRASIPYFLAAVRVAPESLDFQSNLILSLTMSGQHDKAETIIARLLQNTPRAAKLHFLSAFCRLRRDDPKGAIAAADATLEIDPHYTEALSIRGLARSELSQTQAALADFQRIIDIDPDDIEARQNCAERLNELGRGKEALLQYQAILARDPHHAYALSRVALLGDLNSLPGLLETVKTVLAKNPKVREDIALLNMAMATALRRQGRVDEAMTFFDKAHAIDAKDRPYSSTEAWAEFNRLRGLFPKNAPSSTSTGLSEMPIFIVGLPRSGTTLVEMILSSNPNVQACGELVSAERWYREIFASKKAIDEADIERFAQCYRRDLPEVAPGTIAFIDKMPANFRFLGLLMAAFPQSKIVNIQRDPRDVALSMWMQRFPSKGMYYASKMSGIADQANLYQSYMAHWQSLFPDQILSIGYEDLVRDMTAGTRALADHCGVEWDEDMLHPEKNTATIKTASLNQAREEVHDRSIGRWVELGGNLKILEAKLDPKLWTNLA